MASAPDLTASKGGAVVAVANTVSHQLLAVVGTLMSALVILTDIDLEQRVRMLVTPTPVCLLIVLVQH